MNWDKEIGPVSDQMINLPWGNVEFYKSFISQVYYFVRYSTKMLAAAASVTENPEYYKRLVSHIREEEGHEKLALADLKNLGGKIEDYPEFGITRALWEPQFYKIQRSPASLLGYILSLEMIPVHSYPEVLPKIRSTYGEKCVNFIRVHCEEDPAHVKDAINQIQSMPAAEKVLIEKNFIQTTEMMTHLLSEVVRRSALHGEDHQAATLPVKRSA